MTTEQYLTAMWFLVLVVVLPQAVGTYLCFRWARFPRRRWLRLLFISFGTVSGVFAVFRLLAGLAFPDVFSVLFVVAASGVVMHFITTAILYTCTWFFERRFEAAKAVNPEESATAILQGVIDDLVSEGRRRRIL